MNYNLNSLFENKDKKKSTLDAVKSLLKYAAEDKKILILAFISTIISSALLLLGPYSAEYCLSSILSLLLPLMFKPN